MYLAVKNILPFLQMHPNYQVLTRFTQNEGRRNIGFHHKTGLASTQNWICKSSRLLQILYSNTGSKDVCHHRSQSLPWNSARSAGGKSFFFFFYQVFWPQSAYKGDLGSHQGQFIIFSPDPKTQETFVTFCDQFNERSWCFVQYCSRHRYLAKKWPSDASEACDQKHPETQHLGEGHWFGLIWNILLLTDGLSPIFFLGQRWYNFQHGS